MCSHIYLFSSLFLFSPLFSPFLHLSSPLCSVSLSAPPPFDWSFLFPHLFSTKSPIACHLSLSTYSYSSFLLSPSTSITGSRQLTDPTWVHQLVLRQEYLVSLKLTSTSKERKVSLSLQIPTSHQPCLVPLPSPFFPISFQFSCTLFPINF